MLLTFSRTEDLTAPTAGFTATATAITAQIDALDINAARLQEALPQFRLTATAGRNNVLRNILRASDMDFRTVTLDARNEGERLGAGMVINGFSTSGLTLDTLNIGVWRREERLNYHARLRNRPGNIDQMALIAVRGSVQGNTATALLHQENREGRTGCNFGLNASLTPDAVTVTMTPENPTFGYAPLTVNIGNFLAYPFDRGISAPPHALGAH